MKRYLVCSVTVAAATFVASPAVSNIPIALHPVPAKVSLVVIETPQGFAIAGRLVSLPRTDKAPRVPLGRGVAFDRSLIAAKGPARSAAK
jgi:hypothetical protein